MENTASANVIAVPNIEIAGKLAGKITDKSVCRRRVFAREDISGVSILQEAVKQIRSHAPSRPKCGIILGSGLGGVVDHLDARTTLAFSQIPGFAASTAGGHRGQLVLGTLAGVWVVAMAGRFHRYENWSTEQITFPVRVMRELGAGTLIVSNAAGGVNPRLAVGDMVLISDHIDWMFGPAQQRFDRWKFDRSSPSDVATPIRDNAWFPQRSRMLYDPELAEIALAAGRKGGFAITEGTYLATLGPNYETRAEYRMMRRMGVDIVGMSTVPEVITAAACGMRVLALSMVSNVARPDSGQATNHEEVLAAGTATAPRMLAIVHATLNHISD